jgi:hypothetical protein
MGEDSATAELLHITKKYQHLRFEDLPIYRSQNDQCYYVDMPHSPTMIDQQPTKINVVNLDEGSLENTQDLLHETQLSPNVT